MRFYIFSQEIMGLQPARGGSGLGPDQGWIPSVSGQPKWLCL